MTQKEIDKILKSGWSITIYYDGDIASDHRFINDGKGKLTTKKINDRQTTNR